MVTQEHVTDIQAYFLEKYRANKGNDDYAICQRRLQLRLLVLMLARLMPGEPTVDELLTVRHKDLKVYKVDMNNPNQTNDIPPFGDSGSGPHCMLYVRFGPDSNGKDVVFSTLEHRDPNECCFNALGDLMAYEQHCDPVGSAVIGWCTDPDDPSPFLFHAPGQLMTPLSKEEVCQDLEAALVAVGAPPRVEKIGQSAAMRCLAEGCDPRQVWSRTLAPAKPNVSPGILRSLEARDYVQTVEKLADSVLQAAGWKLQRFGDAWPLASLDFIQSRASEKFIHKTMRQVNRLEGCAMCGKKATYYKPLLRCSVCRITLYCQRSCQQAHWKTHKPDCKRILPSKR